jgi:DNA relaxase NicK
VQAAVLAHNLPPTCNTGVGRVDSDAIKVGKKALSGGALFDAGADWLTSTCKDLVHAVELRRRAHELLERYQAAGNEWIDDARALGYAGVACGPVFYGERGDGVMFRASSAAANEALEVTRELKVKATRLDVQATLLMPEDRPDLGLLVANASDAAAEEIAASGRMKWQTRRIDGYGAGDSAIIGARSSEGFGRCYDKHREGLQKYRERVGKFKERRGVYPLGAWRFEVEYKGTQAAQMYERLIRAESVSEAAISHVQRWYSDHGIWLPLEVAHVEPVRTIQRRSDALQTLAWLRDAVQPSIEKLIDMGYRDELFKVLGLGHVGRCACGGSAMYCPNCAEGVASGLWRIS